MKKVVVLALFALFSTSIVPVASAYPIMFAGGGAPGASGFDPFGHIWRIKVDSWGSPGLGDGVLAFGGPSSALDFHIEFFDLPQGVVIDPTPAGGPGGFETTTRFSNLSDNELWNRVIGIGGTDVSFFATPTSSLENGETFFINVHFTGALTGPIGFEASWTGQRAVPEPATAALVLAGLAGAVVRFRRRKQCMASPCPVSETDGRA